MVFLLLPCPELSGKELGVSAEDGPHGEPTPTHMGTVPFLS